MPRPHARPASRIAQGALAFLLASLLAVFTLPVVRAGDGPTTTDPALAAAGWIARQVETDDSLGVGSLADAIFAFAAVGAGQAAAATALAGVEAGLDGFVSPGGALSPGALAKVMLAVQVQGADATAFGGRDLEADLRGLLVVGGADDGRLGTASVFDQALGVLALSRTTGGVPATAVAWLAGRQCPSGEYSFDGSCPAGPGAEDPDTTAIAIQALLAGDETAAADGAVAWLLSIQQPGGGIPSFGTANTNSSGVGAQALRAAGETAAADAAAGFVASLQLGCGADAAEVGAIGWAVGIPGFLIFSTPQAVLAFDAAPFDQLSAGGAAPEAPALDCPTVAPTPAGAPLPSATPGAGEVPDTATRDDRAPTGLMLVALGFIGSAAGLLLRRRAAG